MPPVRLTAWLYLVPATAVMKSAPTHSLQPKGSGPVMPENDTRLGSALRPRSQVAKSVGLKGLESSSSVTTITAKAASSRKKPALYPVRSGSVSAARAAERPFSSPEPMMPWSIISAKTFSASGVVGVT